MLPSVAVTRYHRSKEILPRDVRLVATTLSVGINSLVHSCAHEPIRRPRPENISARHLKRTNNMDYSRSLTQIGGDGPRENWSYTYKCMACEFALQFIPTGLHRFHLRTHSFIHNQDGVRSEVRLGQEFPEQHPVRHVLQDRSLRGAVLEPDGIPNLNKNEERTSK